MSSSKIAISTDDLTASTGSGYPPPFNEICQGRSKKRLSDLFGLSQFGVNQVTLAPGAASSQRHWHEKEDEFIYILAGEATLITDEGETLLTAGMVAGFPANNGNGHQIINKSDSDVILLEVGSRSQEDVAHYPDIDLHVSGPRYNGAKAVFTHKDGTAY